MNSTQGFDVDDAAYRAGHSALAYTATQAALDDAKAGAFVDPAWQSYNPKNDRVEEPKRKEKPAPMNVDTILHRYYVALLFGKLNNVLATRDAEGGDCGDEGAAIVRRVEDEMGVARNTLRPIVLHKMGGFPWASWYGTPSRALASHLFNDFRDRLGESLSAKPFVYDPTPVFREDHLESADRANFQK